LSCWHSAGSIIIEEIKMGEIIREALKSLFEGTLCVLIGFVWGSGITAFFLYRKTTSPVVKVFRIVMASAGIFGGGIILLERNLKPTIILIWVFIGALLGSLISHLFFSPGKTESYQPMEEQNER